MKKSKPQCGLIIEIHIKNNCNLSMKALTETWPNTKDRSGVIGLAISAE
jgi:hypothetical protein